MAYNNREYQKTYITTGATTVVFSGRGTLGGVCINSATAVGAVTVQDNGVTFAVLGSAVTAGKYLENVVISNGLTLINASTDDITVLWAKG